LNTRPVTRFDPKKDHTVGGKGCTKKKSEFDLHKPGGKDLCGPQNTKETPSTLEKSQQSSNVIKIVKGFPSISIIMSVIKTLL
jgi:hypothetical protein